jgi:ubiquitin C-terminal hydrolase
MNLTKYNNKGNVGLVNLGNTCFLNSCIQALSHTFELNELLDKVKTIKKVNESVITNEWNALRKLMWENNDISVSPNKFVHNVQRLAHIKGKELFTGWSQNDMSEFLIFMVDCMHESISRPVHVRITGKSEHGVDELALDCYKMLKTTYAKEYSEIMDLMYGIYVSEITSIDGKVKHATKSESFFVLDLPIPIKPNITIYDCLDAFTKPETLSGDNAWLNEKTGKKEAVNKRMTFWNFPRIIVITLKRFSGNGKHKMNDMVSYPLNDLDLSSYVTGYKPKSYKYELYAVCNHMGNVNGGHYTAFAKKSTNEWVHFNDQNVNVMDPANIVTPMAYCLFYRKKI